MNVVAVGECLWDKLGDDERPGGAPANFAVTAAGLGADAVLISRVGPDERGDELRRWFACCGLPTDTIQRDAAADTGMVDVTLTGGEASYVIRPHAAWDKLAANAAAFAAVKRADAVCFGTLGQREEPARSAVRTLVAAANPDALRLLDVNLRPPFDTPDVIRDSLAMANGVKLNEKELPVLARLLALPGDERAQLAALVERFSLRLVAWTRGAGGSTVFANGEWSDLPAATGPVVDTVGAGDSFTATLVVALLAGLPTPDAHCLASDVAAFVCSQPAATPDLPPQFRAALSPEASP